MPYPAAAGTWQRVVFVTKPLYLLLCLSMYLLNTVVSITDIVLNPQYCIRTDDLRPNQRTESKAICQISNLPVMTQ